MTHTRQHTDHHAIAAQARRQPLTWVLVCYPKDRQAAMSQVHRIHTGVHKAYRTGAYEARHDRDVLGVPRVWTRWMGGAR